MALVYLEDFLELVEELPNDFKHSFAQLRSLDLRVQSASSLCGATGVGRFSWLRQEDQSQERGDKADLLCIKGNDRPM